MSSAPLHPPLPRVDLLIRRSARLAAVPGLTEQALRWHHEAEAQRSAVARDARRLAAPRLWPDTIASFATTGWRVLSAAAPDAPFQLLAAAAASVGLRVEPPHASAATLERAQRLVRRGGPAYVKLGQFIATADGLLPDEWVKAFAWCRDEAPPLQPGVAMGVIERELGALRERLTWVDEQPLATGSIGQVHRGRLDDGTEVVIKVLRPGLRRRFRTDIETFALAAAAAERLHGGARSANLTGFVELFAQLALEELDFRLEAANLVDSSAVLEAMGADDMMAPRPIPGMVTQRVLVMEYLPGVSYSRLDRTREVDGDRLLKVGIQGVLEATLRHGVFHGDLHAGNVLIDESRGTFSLVDFGIAGRLDAAQRAGLVQYLAAWAANDAAGQIAAMQSFGAIEHGADVDALVQELQTELDLLADRARGQVTFDQLGITLGRLLQVLARNGFRMPKDLVLFFKNLLYLSDSPRASRRRPTSSRSSRTSCSSSSPILMRASVRSWVSPPWPDGHDVRAHSPRDRSGIQAPTRSHADGCCSTSCRGPAHGRPRAGREHRSSTRCTQRRLPAAQVRRRSRGRPALVTRRG